MRKLNTLLIRESAFNELRRMILSHELKAGEKLREKELAEQLGVSRTPIREALHKLELEGLVEIYPRRYCLVKGVTHESIHEIHLIRCQLEPLAAFHATTLLTEEEIGRLEDLIKQSEEYVKTLHIKGMMSTNDEFHETINRASNLPRIISILENQHDYVESFRHSFMSREELAIRSLEEHRGILTAIKERQPDLVRELVRQHLEGIFDYEDVVLEDMEQSFGQTNGGDQE